MSFISNKCCIEPFFQLLLLLLKQSSKNSFLYIYSLGVPKVYSEGFTSLVEPASRVDQLDFNKYSWTACYNKKLVFWFKNSSTLIILLCNLL